jgi:8-oxo-dGTP diphosphatase
VKNATLCFILRPARRQILLGLKRRGFGAGKYNGFGGKVLPGESLHEATLREVREETGLRLAAEKLRPAGEITFLFPFEPDFDHHVHVFVTSAGEDEPRESAEMSPMWFGVDAIPYEGMWADDAHWMPLVLAGKRIEATFTFGPDNESLSAWSIREIDPSSAS